MVQQSPLSAVLNVLVQSRREAKAAKSLTCKLLEEQSGAPRLIMTDRLHSYGATNGEIAPGVELRSY